ncbi:MAG: peptidoglycan DD-metalloendopeptidase family protein [Huintestinicola sp.]
MFGFKNGKISGKSTAAVICFCLAAVAALGIFSYNKAADELKNSLTGISSGTSENGEVTAAVTVEEPAENADAPAEVPFTEAAAPREDIILENDAFGDGDEAENIPVEAAAEKDSDMGAVVRPVNGKIICDYSDGELVKSRTLNVWKTHDGIDVAADEGTSVRSMSAGTVKSISDDPLMGVTVIIDHGSGYEGYYSNLSRDLTVTEGEKVSAGSVIGAVGSTAEGEIAEESHLHFGLKKNGAWIDPSEMLSGEGS